MITNTPKTKEQKYEELSAGIEHRATWFYFMLSEAMKAGLDTEFAHKAITQCGCFHAMTKWPKTDSLKEFTKAFANDNVVNIFEMEIKENTEKNMKINFHYCPLVNAWKKLTDDEALIAEMCDIAMDGDRGIVKQYGNFEFHLGKTIAKGDPVCEITVSRKE